MSDDGAVEDLCLLVGPTEVEAVVEIWVIDVVVIIVSGSSVLGGDDVVNFKGIEAVDFDVCVVTLDINVIKGL